MRVVYRLNRGDIQTVREVWFLSTYSLPFARPQAGGTLLDLGGNIGLASVYLAHAHTFDRVVILEPLEENLTIARLNCSLNGIDAEFIEAAVGSRPAKARFQPAQEHNEGRLSATGSREVDVITVASVLEEGERVGLLKIDVEGAEEDVLSGNPSWLEQVDAITIEIHPSLVDYKALVKSVEASGFSWVRRPPGTDAFLRIKRDGLA